MAFSRRTFVFGALSALLASSAVFGDVVVSDSQVQKDGPNLKIGVLSDLHVTDWESTECFRQALAYFHDQQVDVVLVAGDLTEHGLLPELENVAKAWYEVFPEDTGFGGKKVERIFVFGNRDCEGMKRRDAATVASLRTLGLSLNDAENLSMARLGLPECWEKCFHEVYGPVYGRNVNGYDFVAVHWGFDRRARPSKAKMKLVTRGKKKGDEAITLEGLMKPILPGLDTDQPFFFVQHLPPRGTVYAEDCPEADAGAAARCLSGYPNAVAISGHTHLSLTDGRSYWRGEFTSIGASSLDSVRFPEGRENPVDFRRNDECRQGQIISVFDNRLEIRRYDFTYDEPIDGDIVLEMPVKSSTFEMRSVDGDNIPAFKSGAMAKAIKDSEAIEISFPGAFANPKATPYQYLVSVECVLDDCTKRCVDTFWFQTDVCFSRERAAKHGNFATVPLSKIPERTIQALVRVTPYNCYGGSGAGIVSNFIQFKAR